MLRGATGADPVSARSTEVGERGVLGVFGIHDAGGRVWVVWSLWSAAEPAPITDDFLRLLMIRLPATGEIR